MENSREVKIIRNYYDTPTPLFENETITFIEGLNVIVGCNGSGKSTLIRQLQRDGNVQPKFSYDNYLEGGRNAMEKLDFIGDTSGMISRAMASEGENIKMNLGRFVQALRLFIYSPEVDSKERWILLDAVDSGLSIDGIEELKRVCGLVIKDSERLGLKTYIIASSNSYTLAEGSHCIDIRNGKPIKFDSYEHYRRFILDTNDYKLKRYEANKKIEESEIKPRKRTIRGERV